MVDSVGASGVSPSEKANQQQEVQKESSSDSAKEKGISFEDLLSQAKKAVNQGEKTKDLMGTANASNQVQLENILQETEQLEDVFERLFQMIDQLKEKEQLLTETAVANMEGIDDRADTGQQSGDAGEGSEAS